MTQQDGSDRMDRNKSLKQFTFRGYRNGEKWFSDIPFEAQCGISAWAVARELRQRNDFDHYTFWQEAPR